MQTRFLFRRGFALASLVVLVGCGVMDDSLMMQSYRAVARSSDIPSPHFDPRYRYLRIGLQGRWLYPILGDTDGNTEVWYTNSGEVLRLEEGHITAAVGIGADWRHVRVQDRPSWLQVLHQDGAVYQRYRDVMPGYHMNIHDSVRIVPSVAPPTFEAQGLDPSTLRWFEEISTSDDPGFALPHARFAVELNAGNARVVYSEQCLSVNYCMHIQVLPSTPAVDASR